MLAMLRSTFEFAMTVIDCGKKIIVFLMWIITICCQTFLTPTLNRLDQSCLYYTALAQVVIRHLYLASSHPLLYAYPHPPTPPLALAKVDK